jgi:hypothetical protein
MIDLDPGWTVFDRFRRPRDTRQVSWNGIRRWISATEAGLGAERNDLGRRRGAWDIALEDLGGDPSSRDWTSFLILRRDREEDWSDWLAQLLEESSTGRFAAALLGPLEARQPHSYIRPAVHREVSFEGYRADLVIEWTDDTYSHIEVKVGDPHLAKTLTTAEKMAMRFRRFCRSDSVLILPAQQGAWEVECLRQPEMRRVRVLTWIDVAVALRTALPAGAGERISWRVWAHAFCGAIEQDLLRLRSGPEPTAWSQALSLGDLDIARRLLCQETRDAR